jgi:CheY-like chemotaxis protein
VSKGYILIVDDLPDVRVTLSGLLSDEGYDVRSASSREEALRMIAADRFDVAILDVRLDETDEDNQDGLLLMHDIKDETPETVIIILTGYANVKMVRDALQPNQEGEAPAFGFLEKTEVDQLPHYVDRAMKHLALRPQTSLVDLIAQGESAQLEFKSSMRWDVRKGCVNTTLHKVTAKAIAGMMNGEGGILLIGVADDGTIVGIEKDLNTLRKSDVDGFQLALTDIVKNHLGLEFVPYIRPQFGLVQGKYVCVVSIQESPRPVFLNTANTNEFWVRMGNSTHRMDVRAATRYIQEKWG